MAETGPVMVGVGKPEKKSLKDWAKKTFTFEGNEDAWRKTHEKDLEMIRAINDALPPEQRGEAMEKIEKHIANSAKLRVVRNYAGLAAVTAAVVGEAALIINPKWAKAAQETKILGVKWFKPFGWGARMARTGMEGVGKGIESYFTDARNRQKAKLDAINVKNILQRTDALSGAIKMSNLSALDDKHPIAGAVFDKALQPRAFQSNELNDSFSERLIITFINKAKEAKRWVPIVVSPLDNTNLVNHPEKGILLLLEKGMIELKKLDNGMKVYSPTEKLIEFIQHTIEGGK